jgi:hypothetical protein
MTIIGEMGMEGAFRGLCIAAISCSESGQGGCGKEKFLSLNFFRCLIYTPCL